GGGAAVAVTSGAVGADCAAAGGAVRVRSTATVPTTASAPRRTPAPMNVFVLERPGGAAGAPAQVEAVAALPVVAPGGGVLPRASAASSDPATGPTACGAVCGPVL